MVAPFRAATWSRPICGHVQDNAEEAVRRVIDVLNDGAFAYAMDNGAVIQVRDRDRSRGARARRSISPAPAPQLATNFNAPSAVCTRRRALCLPHPGRRRHPDERRLPEAARDRHPRRLDAEAALSGGGGRRQCRDLAMHHRCAVWRARRDGGGARHDEQFHLRQRRATSITRRSAAARARGRISTAPTPCTPT